MSGHGSLVCDCFFRGINDRCHRACLSRRQYTARLFATLCRVASRRDATRRGAVRSGRVGFSSSSLSLALSLRPTAAGPRTTLYHSSLTPSNLLRPPPRAHSPLSSRRIDVSSRSDSHYTSENALINVPRPARKSGGRTLVKGIVPGSHRVSTRDGLLIVPPAP